MIVNTRHGFFLEANEHSFFADELVRNGYENDESELVKKLVRRGDFCVDVGAHVGYYSCLMAMLGARVLAIEPNPMLHPILDANCERFGVPVFHGAIGAKIRDEATFHLPLTTNDGCGSLFGDNRTMGGAAIVTFVQRLDALLSLFLATHVRLIKIDTEGCEAEAIESLGSRLRDVDHLIVECSNLPSCVARDTVGAINLLLKGWRVRRARADSLFVNRAVADGNYWFTNPEAAS